MRWNNSSVLTQRLTSRIDSSLSACLGGEPTPHAPLLKSRRTEHRDRARADNRETSRERTK